MKLFYVYGSGFGHLNRIISYIHNKKYIYSECVILTNSRHTSFLPKEIVIVHRVDSFFKNHTKFQIEFSHLIEANQINELIVDVFPCGFYGELHILQAIKIKKTLLSRILNQSYFNQYRSPCFDELVVFEDGIELYNYQFGKQTKMTFNLKTRYITREIKLKKPFFYIIHSEPDEEVIQLYKFAKLYQKNNEHIYIQTLNKINGLEHIDNITLIPTKKPLLSLLKESQKIFTACGFNIMIETSKFREKQYLFPFKRRYDDQFKRKAILEI